MNNENENFVPEIDPAVKLAGTEQPQAPTNVDIALNAAAQRIGLDEESCGKLRQLLEPMCASTIPQDVVDMLAQALHHDEDVSNAEAAGYVRGRNENINTRLGVPGKDEDIAAAETSFPRYVKRSIWD